MSATVFALALNSFVAGLILPCLVAAETRAWRLVFGVFLAVNVAFCALHLMRLVPA
jgi:hypothetical protein